MNFLGLLCAVTTFLNIWLGHIAVRSIEAQAVSIRIPAAAFFFTGLALVAGAVLTPSKNGQRLTCEVN